MKSIKYFTFGLLMIVATSCGQDWLDVEPSTSVETEGSGIYIEWYLFNDAQL